MSDLNRLIDAYLNGELTHEQHDELVDLLLSDDRCVEEFVRSAHLAAAIGRELRSDKRRSRFQPQRRRKVRRSGVGWPFAAALASAAAAVVLFLHLGAEPVDQDTSPVPPTFETIAKFHTSSGASLVRAGSDSLVPAEPGLEIGAGDTVITHGKRSVVAFVTGSSVESGFGSRMTLDLAAEGGPPFIALTRGDLTARVVPRDVGLTVTTPFGRFVDIGTAFTVSVDESSAMASVIEGRIKASTAAGEVEIVRGQIARLIGNDALPVVTLTPADKLLHEEFVGPIDRTRWSVWAPWQENRAETSPPREGAWEALVEGGRLVLRGTNDSPGWESAALVSRSRFDLEGGLRLTVRVRGNVLGVDQYAGVRLAASDDNTVSKPQIAAFFRDGAVRLMLNNTEKILWRSRGPAMDFSGEWTEVSLLLGRERITLSLDDEMVCDVEHGLEFDGVHVLLEAGSKNSDGSVKVEWEWVSLEALSEEK